MNSKKTDRNAQSKKWHSERGSARITFSAAALCLLFLMVCLLTGCGRESEQKGSVSPAASSANTSEKVSEQSPEKTPQKAPAASADADSSAASAASAAGSSAADASASAASAAAVPAPAEEGKKEDGPRMLKYIDAWKEWHTMEIDPAVRETAYDPAGFIHSEEDPQRVIYTGKILSGAESADEAADQAVQDKTASTGQEQGETDLPYECLQGIDVSEHQGVIDWQAVADAGYQFAFIRVGYRGYGEAGRLLEDNMAVENLRQAKAAGLYVGTYFFSQALSEEEAAEEASLAVSVIEKSGVETDLPLMYDPEIIKDDWGRANEITREQVTLNTAAFRKAVESASSCRVDIYSNLPWEHNYFDAETMNTYDIWYADYEPLPQTPYHFTWWQYSNEGSVPGIEGMVDLNLWIRKK